MTSEMGIEELIAEYATEGSDLGEAILGAEMKQFELMKQYEEGVPSGVMFTASMTGMEWIAQLMAGMLTEVRAAVEDWSKEEEKEQEDMTKAVFKLLRIHASNTILATYLPAEDTDG